MGGLGDQAADRTYRGLYWPLLRHRREAESQRIFGRSSAPWAAGSWDSWTYTNPACPASPAAKGTTAPFSPGSGKERSGSCFCVQSPSSPAAQESKHLPEGLHGAKGKWGHHRPNPGSWSTPFLFPCKSRTWLHSLRHRERGARRREPAQPVFPLHSQGISFVWSRVWHIPVQSSSRTAVPSRASRGTRWDRSWPGTGRDRDREAATRISRAGPCSEESGRTRCMCRATLGTISVTDNPAQH